MKRILVTGGAGFIGSAFCRRAARERGVALTILDKMSYASSRDALAAALVGDHRLVEGDICDAALLGDLFANVRPHGVVHFAAETHVDRSIDAANAFIHSNVVGVWRLLEAARAHWETLRGAERERFRLLHISTDEVFGALGSEDAPFSETSAYDPRSPYAASKAAGDHLVRAWGHTYGLPVLITNTSNNYGPYQFPEKLIPLMIANALRGAPLPVYGDGAQVRDWLHVDDHIEALARVMEGGRVGATYLIGARNERTNLQVVEAIADLTDAVHPDAAPHRARIVHAPDRPGHDRRYAINPSRIEGELNWRARITFEEGLAATHKWYVDNASWWRAIFAERYGGERLGAFDGKVT